MVSRISLQARASRLAASDLCRYSPISSARKEARVRSCAIEVSSRTRGVSDMGASIHGSVYLYSSCFLASPNPKPAAGAAGHRSLVPVDRHGCSLGLDVHEVVDVRFQ